MGSWTPIIQAAVVLSFCWGTVHSVEAEQRVWTGLGTDDLWSNPANWQDGMLPTGDDVVVFEPGADWSTRQQSVTINGTAAARDLSFDHFGQEIFAFQSMNILPDADYSLRNEKVDQSNLRAGLYEQSGGTHTVADDFSYTTAFGQFRMTGGTFTVGGTLLAGPENGSVEIAGTSRVAARTLSIGAPSFNSEDQASFTLAGSADVRVTGQLHLEAGSSLSVSRPIRMEGADFTATSDSSERIWGGVFGGGFPTVGLDQVHLIFEGGLNDISTFQTDWPNQGVDPANWLIDFRPFGGLELGDDQPGYLQLTGGFEFGGVPFDALYTNELAIGPSSILDLNGHSLYIQSGSGFIPVLRGPFGEGQVINSAIPAPAAILLGALGTTLVACLHRRRAL